MRRDTENTLLILLGVSVAMIAVTGTFTRYVKPGLLPWLAVSAVVLVGLGLAAIVRDVRRGHTDHDHEGHHDHTHKHGATWFLVLPIILLIFIVPPALSPRSIAAANVAASANTPRRAFPPLPPGEAPAVPLPEVLMRIAAGSSDTLAGRTITVTGFTLKEGERTDLAKIVIVCCAADAQLARLHMTGPAAASASALPENTWVSVTGTVPGGQSYRGPSSIPVIEVTGLTRTDPPKSTY
ncbi:TIGR03943 family protein [Mycobacterium sp. CBMA271]|uniref:TIGR03943 family putative permease subunit n=1 Tax=unclassified Mycobacteroides TaxID=2618759 RepID=UPI0013208B4F|nr:MULTISPECIES: TIGR03943 family protein [unclassified Mycobacteroides]MUM18474.1 TIGR03943 family protein [Mycobacteroides sp. CBMA 326]MUM23743.1 TIGR03943 family protein [Mycobacteroides sp. CBMA 271]